MHCQWWFQLIWYFIFEKSRKSGDIPEDWRKANVSPIHKKALKVAPGNYKPVSLTSVPGKVRERILLGTITSQVKDMTGKSQHGFTKGELCLTKLLQQSNLFGRCGVSRGHYLPGFFQGFQYGFSQSLPGETDALQSRQVVCDWLAGNTQQVEEKLARCHRWGPPGPKAV